MDVVLRMLLSSSEKDRVHADIAGCSFALVILRALAAEISLKALCERGASTSINWTTHDLYDIFAKLDKSVQTRLEQIFKATLNKKFGDNENRTMEQVLTDHRDDFVKWRYTYEAANSSSTEMIYLVPAIEAILEECGTNYFE